ncbi:TetR/AcrR family transcriptional regulator [Alsobacter sp. KACC 23698]|uniref:TetR/AcrR family transcriptional regulator n=1 Tax=Alsobacter sp. KACC 23698 TaxID=3149229 RepID=A0AAU7JHH6_9HYPH
MSLDDVASPDRHVRILDAAERCFARAGFHRTTMQDVAAEAQMSAGNLYRYFRSKDAIVAGLSERDRQEVAADFTQAGAAMGFFEALEHLGRKHIVDAPREKSIVLLEIWSEATRNPTVGAACGAIDGELSTLLAAMVEAAKGSGQLPAEVDAHFACTVLFTMADGLFKRRALDPEFDGERELANAMAVFRAVFTGQVRPAREISPRDPSSTVSSEAPS